MRGASIFDQFLLYFNQVKDAAKGEPTRIETFYTQSEQIRSACNSLLQFLCTSDFERRVFYGDKKIFNCVPGQFETEWRDYEQNWRSVIYGPEDSDFEEMLSEIFDSGNEPTAPDDPHIIGGNNNDVWFDPRVYNGGVAIKAGIECLSGLHDIYNSDISFEYEAGGIRGEYGEISQISLNAFDYLENSIGIKLCDVFKRWKSVPNVFMPAHVSNQHGREKGSLLHLLDDAVRAFVAGAPAAAIAMCRAALEIVLKKHYGLDVTYTKKNGDTREKPLGELIILASEKYDFFPQKRVRDLKDKANTIMHNYSEGMPLSNEDERTIIEFLRTVKFLIERAPGK